MKISNASKKVLASALSAAMVVAFAPTVAFAKIPEGTNNVTVNFDVNGGTVADTTVSDSHTGVVQSAKASVAADGTLTIANIADYATVAEKADAAIDHWFYDANGDGKDTSAVSGDTSGDLKYEASAGFSTETLAKDTTAITLKAAYKEPTATPTFTFGADEVLTAASVEASNLNTKYQYYATLTLADGTVLTSEVAAKGATATFNFFANMKDAQKKLAKGTYKFAVYKNGSADAVATESVDIFAVTLNAGAGYGTYTAGAKTTYLVKKDTTYDALHGLSLTEPTIESGTGAYHFVQYVDANGVAVAAAATAKVTADTTLTAVYDNLQVSEVKADVAHKTLSFKALGQFADLGADGQYNATVTGPNGFKKVIENVSVNTAAATAVASGSLTFGADWEGAAAVKNALEAGEYTVSIAPVAKEGKTLAAEQAGQVIAPASATLATVTYDLDGGSWIPGADGKDSALKKGLVTLAQTGDSITAIATEAKKASAVGANAIKAPELKSFKEWSYNGKAEDKADAVTASGVTVKAVWQDAKIAAPEVSIAASGTKYVFTVTAAADTAVKYGIGDSGVTATKKLAAGATITVDPAADKYIAIQAESTKTNLVSEQVVYASYTVYTTSVGNAMTDIMNTSTSASAVNKPVRYGDALKTLKTDAEATVKAAGYQSTADWAKTVAAINADAFGKVAAIEKANVEALKAVTKGADGKYSYISAATADAASAQIDAVVADYAGFTGEGKDSYKQTNTIKGVSLTKNSAMAAFIAAAKAAVSEAKAAKIVVAAADVEAAQKVTDALKAAKTTDEVKAALEAYNKLTNAQKDLVSASDIEAAQKVAAEQAAAELVIAQDDAAVSKVKGKTVKAKAKKATKSSLKVVTSKSGAKSTFKKVTKNSKVTVSKSGKITVKKGLKAGKKYTVKVKATVGTQTKTVKVIVKVAK